MIIGFIGFGKVSESLTKSFIFEKVISSDEGRSQETVDRMRENYVDILPTFDQVVSMADIVISANSPASALEIASEYGPKTKGIYLDLNNISATTAKKIDKVANNFVDGAIIGKVEGSPMLYLSGELSDKVQFLDSYLPVKIVSDKIGDAAILKLLRSIYTKSLSAALIETMDIAEKLDLSGEVLETIAYSEGEEFKQKAISRIENTKNNPVRKIEEVEEIISYFGHDNDLTMTRATFDKFSKL